MKKFWYWYFLRILCNHATRIILEYSAALKALDLEMIYGHYMVIKVIQWSRIMNGFIDVILLAIIIYAKLNRHYVDITSNHMLHIISLTINDWNNEYEVEFSFSIKSCVGHRSMFSNIFNIFSRYIFFISSISCLYSLCLEVYRIFDFSIVCKPYREVHINCIYFEIYIWIAYLRI